MEVARDREPDTTPRTNAGWRRRRITVAVVLGLPTVGFGLTVALAARGDLGFADAVLFAVFYLFSSFGITVGYHRLFTHGAFEAAPWVRAVFAVAGGFAAEGPAIDWVADHRLHHARSDEHGDPHSPVQPPRSRLAGLWHAHVGWQFARDKTNVPRFAPDLLADPLLAWQKRWYRALMLVSLAAPAAAGALVHGTAEGALYGLIVAGLARIFVGHHVTFAVNSVCHVYGRRPFRTRDESRDNVWLALPTLGEAYHNGHHAFPTSAVHGLGPRDVDLSALLIRVLERLGLAWNVRRPDPAQIERRRLAVEP